MITLSDLHRKHMIEQVQAGVLNMQMAVHNNALTHKQWATEEQPLAELQEKITATIAAYSAIRARIQHFRNVTAVNDPGIGVVGTALRATLQDLWATAQELAAFIQTFAGMPRTTYQEIITACDYLIDNVNSPPSVWD